MNEVSFTAGITFHDGRVVTVDVTAIDDVGITYKSEERPGHAAWVDVKAVMLATTDHMLESAGSLFSMAERLEAAGDEGGPEMRRFGLRLLEQAAPRMCPVGDRCGLRSGFAGQP